MLRLIPIDHQEKLAHKPSERDAAHAARLKGIVRPEKMIDVSITEVIPFDYENSHINTG